MTRSHGRKAALWIDNEAGTCKALQADLTSITANFSKANPETTALGDDDVAREVDGLRDYSLDISALFSTGTSGCFLDVMNDMYTGGSSYRRVIYAPAGSVAGSPVYTACMRLNNYSVTTPVDGVATMSATLENSFGTVASSLAV
jgi:hypothetical protein